MNYDLPPEYENIEHSDVKKIKEEYDSLEKEKILLSIKELLESNSLNTINCDFHINDIRITIEKKSNKSYFVRFYSNIKKSTIEYVCSSISYYLIFKLLKYTIWIF